MVHILDALTLPINSNINNDAKRNANKARMLLAAGCLAPFFMGYLAFSSKYYALALLSYSSFCLTRIFYLNSD
jgi:hypothetical protein